MWIVVRDVLENSLSFGQTLYQKDKQGYAYDVWLFFFFRNKLLCGESNSTKF